MNRRRIARLIATTSLIVCSVVATLLWREGTYPLTAVAASVVAVGLLGGLAFERPERSRERRRAGRNEEEIVGLRAALRASPSVLLVAERGPGVIMASDRAVEMLSISVPCPNALLPPPIRGLLFDESKPADDSRVSIRGPWGPTPYRYETKRVSFGQRELCVLALAEVETREVDEDGRERRKMLRVLNHEIMNSLTPIVSLASAALELTAELSQRGGEERSELIVELETALRTLHQRSKRLQRFVEDYRRLGTSPVPETAPVSAHELVGAVVEATCRQADAAGVTLRTAFPSQTGSGSLCVRADWKLVEQLVLNLVANAIAAAAETPQKPGRGSVTIELREKSASFAEICVLDDGPGLSAEAKRNLFVPFFSTKAGGSGIGLVVSRDIAAAHGGSLRYRREGDRTCFALSLPRCSE
jgi:signal transduction histidine kinase